MLAPRRAFASSLVFLALLWLAAPAQAAAPPIRTVSLNGMWQVSLDENADARRVAAMPASAMRPTPVPAVIEESFPGYDGVIWYRKGFRLPAGWTGKRVFLTVGAANYTAQAWLNGRYVGCHEGGYTPFELELTPHLRRRANLLCIRVVDPPRARSIDGLRTGPGLVSRIPAGKEGWYFNFGGIWQEVSLRCSGELAIRHLACKPRNDGTLKLEVETDMAGPATVAQVDITLTGPDGAACPGLKAQRIVLHPGVNSHRFVLHTPSPRLWEPGHPDLYTVSVTCTADGIEQDERTARFGFREFHIRNGRFNLNGRDLILRSALVQGHYPGTLAYPADAQATRNEVQAAHDAGLNALRMHLKPPHPALLAAADELGLLVYDETPIGWLMDSPEMAARCRSELAGMIRRDINHPSVVFWGILNEQFSAEPGGLNARSIQAELVSLALSLDDTRVIAANSFSTMLDPSDPAPTDPLAEPHDYKPGPTRAAVLEGWARLADHPSIYMGEIGVGSLPDYDRVLAAFDARFGPGRDFEDKRFYREARDRILRNVVPSIPEGMLGAATPAAKLQALVRASRETQAAYTWEQLSAVMSNPRLRGFSYTGWRDAFEECQGIYDLWGEPKPVREVIRKLGRPNCPTIRLSRNCALPGDPLRVNASLLNPTPGTAGARFEVTVAGSTLLSGVVPAAQDPLLPIALATDAEVRAPEAPGDYTVELRVSAPGGNATTGAELAVLAPAEGNGGKGGAVLSARRDPPARFEAELQSVANGGRAVVLLDAEGAIPAPLRASLSAGASLALLPDPYICTLHMGIDSPLTAGLGHGILSHRKWSEVLPRYGIRGVAGSAVLGVFSGSWFYPTYAESFDATLVIVDHGKGQLLLTTLELAEAAGRDDRLAQRMLANLDAWLGGKG